MGLRRPAQMSSRLAYGLPEDIVDAPGPKAPSALIPLLLLVLGLAAAMAWYVVLPAFSSSPARVERACEVYVLTSGKTKCVPLRASAAKAPQPAPKRAKRS